MGRVPELRFVPDGRHCSDYDDTAHENCECGLYIKKPDFDAFVETNQLPTLDQRMLASARLMERGHGQAPQKKDIDINVSGKVEVDNKYFHYLDDKKLNALSQALLGKEVMQLSDPDELDVGLDPEDIQDAVFADLVENTNE